MHASIKLLTEEAAGTPYYLFDLDAFSDRCEKVKEYLGDISLTFSMKANPFLLNGIPDVIGHIEVCSPGELAICEKMGIAPKRIIYSGVMKEEKDITEAVRYGVDFMTAESLLHVKLENEAVCRRESTQQKPEIKDEKSIANFRHQEPVNGGKSISSGAAAEKRKVLLRLTSGNQFGMSADDIHSIISNRDAYEGLDFYGIHYYSGTQKKTRQIKKDFERLEHLLNSLKEKYGYEPKLVEYGPGAAAAYFDENCEENDWTEFAKTAELIQAFAEKYPTGIEMGRFLASSCGLFVTQIKDMKVNSETNYLICDGGIHHLRYYGQTMAMQIPPMELIKADTNGKGFHPDSQSKDKIPYMICGSLCTTADILVREVELPPVHIGDYLVFGRCGAYSVTEASYLFLSRTMPRIYLSDQTHGLRLARDFKEAYELNIGTGDME